MKKKLVIALGGNALLQRGEILSAENQQKSIQLFSQMVAQLARDYQLVIVHGNGPQWDCWPCRMLPTRVRLPGRWISWLPKARG